MSSKGIEPFTAVSQFFYREPPLPIGSPALINIILLDQFLYIYNFYFYIIILLFIYFMII